MPDNARTAQELADECIKLHGEAMKALWNTLPKLERLAALASPEQSEDGGGADLTPTAYMFREGGHGRIETVMQPDGRRLWAVRDGYGCCLNHSGKWEDEPSPSNRDADFIARCRFASPREAADAIRAAIAAKEQSDGK